MPSSNVAGLAPRVSFSRWMAPQVFLRMWMSLCLGVAILALMGRAYAADPETQAIMPTVSTVCAACHGLDGNSTNTAVPSLAGQGRAYLRGQLRAFRAQRRTGVMSAVAAGLTDREINELSVYFSRQVPKPDTEAAQNLWVLGESIYQGGIANKHVPACASCHSSSGRGLPPEFPRLAGAHPEYLAMQLRAFRSGVRASNSNAMMRIVSRHLSDREIDALSQYIAGLH